ncbi:hypothetical protein HHL19_16695 [Streptomyces sp. R302]|uniref:hypothetical protein n=1 Tax=unclassified Streptomyces TaxID=2593676 RepID=UPI00145C901F|nr:MULTISPECIES: hypothetical protein [unclassified Streptomyces]NML55408.1 hypothetical protein [Streptomyces sp. R301]NML80280.1 hypothetical protein [Streptomyces sp. R302]
MSSLTRDLAAALRRSAVTAGADEPSVRGSDWRLATVATVGTNGTVTTADGIIARRLQSYTGPAVDDLIVITRSSAGSWLAAGKLESGNDSWTALTLAAGWAPQGNYYVPAYRLYSDGTAGLSGMAVLSGALASGTVVTTLPTVARPAAQVRFTAQVAIGFFGVMTILTNGQVQLGDFSGTLSPTGNKWAQFDVAARYRRLT